MKLFDLSGRVALVTGSTRGIGRAIAEALVAAGAAVVVSSEDPGDTARTAMESSQIGIVCDVTNDAALAAMVEGVIARLGPARHPRVNEPSSAGWHVDHDGS